MKNKTFLIAIGIILTLFVILMCWGCQAKTPAVTPENAAAAISQPFDAKATIRLKDLVMTADINKTAPKTATIQLNEPKTLSGMQFQMDGENVNVSYRGLSVKLNENSRLVSSIAALIIGTIDKASSPSGVNVEMKGNALIVSGKSDEGEFSILLDRQNGSIASISLPELDFECHFDDFLFQKEE